MTQEEKAKAYDEALEKAEGVIRYYKERNRDEAAIEDLEYIFPVLKESSDDERIRKELLRFHASTIDIDGIQGKEILAWLEKQGKQNFANSAKTCKDEQKLSNLESIGEDWSKEDEVKINRIVGFIENLNIPDNDILRKDAAWLKSLKERVQPKQEWDKEDEKTLDKLITNYESGYLPPVAERCEYIIWLKSLKSHPRLELSAEDLEWFEKQGKRKSTWSKEDERILEQIKFAVLNLPSYRKDTRQECIDWLKLLKERIGG